MEKQIRWTEADSLGLASMLARSCEACGHTPTDVDERVIGDCVPGYHTYALTETALEDGRKRDALDRFIGGDDDAFVDVIRENPDLKAALKADPLEPEPEDDEETITYPEYWDRMGDRVIVGSCLAIIVLIWVPVIWFAVTR